MAENNFQETGRLVYAKSQVFAARTGLLTGTIANAINEGLFGLRNVDQGAGNITEELIVDQVTWGFVTDSSVAPTPAPFAVPDPPSFLLYKATSYSSNFNVNVTAVTPIRKRVADHTVIPSTEVSCAVATTASSSGGGYAVDAAAPLDILLCDTAVVGTTAFHQGRSIWRPGQGISFTLGPNEGLVVRPQRFVAGAGQGRLWINVDTRRA